MEVNILIIIRKKTLKPSFAARPACQLWNKRRNLDEDGEKGVEDKISEFWYLL